MPIRLGYNCNLGASACHLEIVFDGLSKGDIPLSNIIRGGYPKEAFGFSLDPCPNVVRRANGNADELGMKGVTNKGAYCLRVQNVFETRNSGKVAAETSDLQNLTVS